MSEKVKDLASKLLIEAVVDGYSEEEIDYKNLQSIRSALSLMGAVVGVSASSKFDKDSSELVVTVSKSYRDRVREIDGKMFIQIDLPGKEKPVDADADTEVLIDARFIIDSSTRTIGDVMRSGTSYTEMFDGEEIEVFYSDDLERTSIDQSAPVVDSFPGMVNLTILMRCLISAMNDGEVIYLPLENLSSATSTKPEKVIKAVEKSCEVFRNGSNGKWHVSALQYGEYVKISKREII